MILSRLPRHLSHLGRRAPSISRSNSPLLARLPSAFLSTAPTWRTRFEVPRDDRSEDISLRNLSFGGDGDGAGVGDRDVDRRQGAQNPQLRHRRAASPAAMRDDDQVDSSPLSRGDLSRKRRETPPRSRDGIAGGRGGDLFPDFGDERRTGRRLGPSGRMSGRQEHQEDLAPHQRTMREFGDEHNKEKFDTSRQKFPTPWDSDPKESDQKLGLGHPSADYIAQSKGDHNGDSILKTLDFREVRSGKQIEKNENKRPLDAMSSDESVASGAILPDADEVFKKMKETGLIPNAVAMLDGLCKDGLLQEAMKLFGLMREKGTIPEVVIYTAVVEGFCKAAKFDDAKRIFMKMQKNGIVPNAFSYTVLIQGLTKGGKLNDSIEFCLEMLNSGHSPNMATFVDFLDRFSKEKGIEQAEDVIKRLQERGFVLDEKAVREYLDKKGPFSPMMWEAIFGKKKPQRQF